jgi:hypothetical protein
MKNRFKEKINGCSERNFIFRGGRKSIIFLEGSHATPARPSGRNNVKLKTLSTFQCLSEATPYHHNVFKAEARLNVI